MIREFISPSLRFEIREKSAWLRELLSRVRIWNWEIAKLPQNGDKLYDVIYIGRNSKRKLAQALLNVQNDDGKVSTKKIDLNRTVFVCDMPFPGALRVPSKLSSIVPLGRSIDEIMENYHSQLRRELRRDRVRYRLQKVLDNDEIKRVDRELLQPYAIARHGSGASQLAFDDIQSMAQKHGRLDLLLLGDEVVGCQLGNDFFRKNKRYWSVNRFGYPEAVYSDPKRLRDTNSMNNHLAIEYAINNGFDYYDIGVSLGRPGDGLLEWKRRRGGELDTLGNKVYLYIRPPGAKKAEFFWNTPLFAIERNKVTLHLGLPVGPSDDEIANRYREMGFGGLIKVYLYCSKTPSEPLIDTLRSFYSHQKSPPNLKVILST